MNKNVRLAISVVLGLCAFFFVKNMFSDREPDVTSREFLTKVADEVNRTLPKPVDQNTELTHISAGEGMLTYNYKLLSLNSIDIDIDAFVSEMRPGIVNGACTQFDLKSKYLDKGVTLRYSYKDKRRNHVANIDVTLADCSR